jgi:phosphoglycolate phosphatase-like HAD superfamily hydrolase
MKARKVVAFDLDGTLFNSRSVSFDAIRVGFERFWADYGVKGPVLSWDRVKRNIGLPSYEFYADLLPEGYKENWKILHRYVSEAEQRHLAEGRGRTFHGVHATLDRLLELGFELRCLSNASKRYFDAIMDECNLRRFFSKMMWLGEDLAHSKTDILARWAREVGKENILYVGDRLGDVRSAHAAGIDVVAVSYGYGERDELGEAEAVIDQFPDLLRNLTPHARTVFRWASGIIDAHTEKNRDFLVGISGGNVSECHALAEEIEHELYLRGQKASVIDFAECLNSRKRKSGEGTIVLACGYSPGDVSSDVAVDYIVKSG